jgi:hypothetical protein
MNFSTPQRVQDTIRACDEVERVRGDNRRKINDLFNSAPPLSEEEAKKWGLQVNVNWGEGPVLAAHARRQYETAFMGSQNYFKIRIPRAPVETKTAWELGITEFINNVLKESEDYAWVHENKWAGVIAHGYGIQVWYDPEDWCPEFVAIEDFRVPTDTQSNLKNLAWFAVRNAYTPGELSSKVWGPYSRTGWNKKVIAEVLEDLKDINFEASEYTWMTSPEKMAELYKQNLGYYSSDAVPTIPLWHFFYVDEEDPAHKKWHMCIVPDVDSGVHHMPADEFVYESPDPVGIDRANLVHCQIGDLNNKPKFMFHSVRSLGLLLVEPCFWTNLARCKYLQYVFEQFQIWLRVMDPAGKARAQMVRLADKAVIPEGVGIVPQTERHNIDKSVVESALGQLKQLMAEAAQTYTQSTDTGTQREQTAFETRTKLESVNAMMSGLLGRASRKEIASYKEICRRFCLRKTENADARRFQEHCRKVLKIPRLWVNAELWALEPEMPIGAGNPTMAAATAQDLMAIRPACDASAQQEILHEVIEISTKDPRRADRWAPINGKQQVTDAVRDAEFAFGTLMQGVPVRMKEGLSPREQAETLIGLMSGVISRITQQTNLATPNELAGLDSVGQYTGQLLNTLAGDPQQQQVVKKLGDDLTKLSNIVKGFMQRAQQAAKKAAAQGQQNGDNGQAAAHVQSATIKATADAKISEAKAAQERKHKEADFLLDQRRKHAGAISQEHREGLRTGAQIHRDNLATGAQIQRDNLTAFNQPEEE